MENPAHQPATPEPISNQPTYTPQPHNPSHKKRKTILIIILTAVLILALSIVGFLLIYHPVKAPSKPEPPESTEDNQPEKDNDPAANKPTNPSSQNTESYPEIDKIAAQLFTQALTTLTAISASDSCSYGSSPTSEGITLAEPNQQKTINGIAYNKTTLKYQDAIDKYFYVLADPLLSSAMSGHFMNIDGILYCVHGGATGYGFSGVKVSLIKRQNDKYIYKASYNSQDNLDETPAEYSRPATSQFTIEKINNTWKVSQLD